MPYPDSMTSYDHEYLDEYFEGDEEEWLRKP